MDQNILARKNRACVQLRANSESRSDSSLLIRAMSPDNVCVSGCLSGKKGSKAERIFQSPHQVWELLKAHSIQFPLKLISGNQIPCGALRCPGS